jgi:hypothetical protein
MSATLNAVLQNVIDFVRTQDFVQDLAILGIALLSTAVGLSLAGRARRSGLKKALKAELATNLKVTKAIIAYADGQLSGDTSVAPMPKYRTVAFMDYMKSGLLGKMPKRMGDELERVYLNMVSINRAGRRQEELAFGPAAAFPNAHTLRLENLTYVRDTAHNIVEPYQGRLSDVKL